MARTVIPTNFQDDELAEEMQGRRRYRQILNLDGTVSFVDETDYNTEGSTFGASRVNEMAQNINESADVNKIIDDLEDIAVVTQNGFMAGAKAVKELNSNLTANSNPFKFGYEDGQYGYYLPDGEGGADTLHPFSSLNEPAIEYSYTTRDDTTETIDLGNLSAGNHLISITCTDYSVARIALTVNGDTYISNYNSYATPVDLFYSHHEEWSHQLIGIWNIAQSGSAMATIYSYYRDYNVTIKIY